MAFRCVNKINSVAIKDTCAITIRCLGISHQEMPRSVDDIKQEMIDSNVVKSRAANLNSMRPNISNEAQLFKENARKQHLQPSLLPEYFTSNTDFTAVEAKLGKDRRY